MVGIGLLSINIGQLSFVYIYSVCSKLFPQLPKLVWIDNYLKSNGKQPSKLTFCASRFYFLEITSSGRHGNRLITDCKCDCHFTLLWGHSLLWLTSHAFELGIWQFVNLHLILLLASGPTYKRQLSTSAFQACYELDQSLFEWYNVLVIALRIFSIHL